MATKKRNSTSKRRPERLTKKDLRFFFINKELCRWLHLQTGANILTVWNYTRGQRQAYNYSDVKKLSERAFTTAQVASMINRKRITIAIAMMNGEVPAPQMTYSLDEERKPYKYMWHEDDIMGLLEYFSTRHRGKKRKDGLITPQKLPTPSELRAQIRQDVVLYVQTEDGDFVPTWRAETF